MSNTPQKKLAVPGFSPVILQQSPVVSPQKNLTGPPRIAKDIAADLYNAVQKWNNLHIQGTHLIKQIALIKSDMFGSYSLELEQQIDELYKVVDIIKTHIDTFEKLKNQMSALEKLQSKNEILFTSCNLCELKEFVENVADAYIKEFVVKKMVLENIAHSRNQDNLMFFAASWSLQPHITKDVNLKLEALLVETGHHYYQ